MKTEPSQSLVRQAKGPIVTCALLALISLGSFLPATAQEPPPYYVYLPLVSYDDPNVLVSEGFEAGAVPPPGWSLIQNDPDPMYTWRVWPTDPPRLPPTYPPAYAGLYSAACEGAEGVQHEVLLSPPFQASSAQLEFQSFGDVFWCGNVYPYYGCGLKVWLVVGDWDGIDPAEPDVLVYRANQDWPEDPNGYFVWSPSTVDLTPFLPSEVPVRLGFENYANSYGGGLVGLDAVRLARP